MEREGQFVAQSSLKEGLDRRETFRGYSNISEDASPVSDNSSSTKHHLLSTSPRPGTGSSLRGITSHLFRRDATTAEPDHHGWDTRGPLGLTTIHEPQGKSCLIDIIFVHGLGGGSRKTWSAAPTEEAFWPKTWLSLDPDFQEARIHTYGYNSDWGNRTKSILNIEDFAQALLSTMNNHPLLRRTQTRTILVGHSMGGCVAKKAYILARENPIYEDLAARLHSIFFLGTPHRGSNLAVVLRNMLQFAWGSKPYVDDLAPDSSILAAMNDEFRNYANDLRLWSFFETLPMSGLNRLVVDKLSATLGFGNEEVSFMDADHRNVCKFQSQDDPNYQKLRNSLSNAIDHIKSGTVTAETRDIIAQPSINDRERVRNFLGLADNDSLENDLAMLEDFKLPGSCMWFTETSCFDSWATPGPKTSPILWLTGRPGAGKSVLSAHVLGHLRQRHPRCSYYIFKHGKSGARNIASLLTSLAFQMALQDSQVLLRLRQLDEEAVGWDSHDERAIWRKLFVSGIFKLDSISTHVWVIDALDECVKFSNFFKLISQLPHGLRVFITSRSVPEIERGISSLGSLVSLRPLSSTDTGEDLRQYVNSQLDETMHKDAKSLVERILEKANGSFLWTRLVIQDLEMTYTEEDVDSVLNEIPEDLFDVYERILCGIESDRRRARLAKSILTWVSLASRPLSVKELQQAVKLDINEMLQPAEKAIVTVCGQFVFVDSSSRVQLIHETARAFLLSEALTSHIAIVAAQGHSRIAVLCLGYLNAHLKPNYLPRTSSLKARVDPATDACLLTYAGCFFSDHVHKADTEDLQILTELRKFLEGTILDLIEYHARSGNLSPITRVAVNLGSYLGRLSKHIPPTDKNRQIIELWIVDMIRVCAKFQKYLLGCPSSIHLLIPSLCPVDSAIARRFTAPATIGMRGLRDQYWDDCLMRLDFHEGLSTSVGHGERYFAVGRSNGEIGVYDMTTLQVRVCMRQQGRVLCLEFGPEDKFLASSGKSVVTIWDPRTAAELKRFSSAQALALRFTPDTTLLLASKANNILSIHVESSQVDNISLSEANPLSFILPSQPPTKAAFSSSDFGMLALAYRSYPVLVVDTDNGQLLGQCSVGWNNGVNAIVFNPRAEISALVVAYTDGNLVVFDLHTFGSTFIAKHVYSNALACSSDGRSLVSGSNSGVIEIYEFAGAEGNDLELIHRINTSEPDIRGMAFSSDGLRFVNISPGRCRVWEPATLVRRDADWMSSSDLSTPPPLTPRTSTTGMLEGSSTPYITALDGIVNETMVICGKKDGSVTLYSTEDGNEIEQLYSHARGVCVVSVTTQPAQALVASADESGRVLVSEMTETLPHWSYASVKLDKRFEGAISKVLLSSNCHYILVVGSTIGQVWDLVSGETFGHLEWTESSQRTVVTHPENPDWIMVIDHGTVRVFTWSKLEEIIEETVEYSSNVGIDQYCKHQLNREWFFEMVKIRGDRRASQARFCELSRLFGPGRSTPNPVILDDADGLGLRLRDIIALRGSRLFFLDANLWICSLDLGSFTHTKLAHRHFFILPEWLTSNGRLLCVMNEIGDFVFANRYGIAVIMRGLEFDESITMANEGDWQVVSGSMHRRTSLATSASPAPRPGNSRNLYSANLRSDAEVGTRS